MDSLRVLYRDVDRTPYLFTLRRCARELGLELDLIGTSARDREWPTQLEREEVDLISDNYWRLQLDRARGVPYVAIATASNVFPEKLFVHPSVQALDDLRGKRLAVRSAGPQLLFPRMWLRDHGLADDVEQVVYPESETGRWGHWKPVAAGECHACFITDLYVEAPRQAGLRELPVARYPYADGYITFTTTEVLVERKRPALQLLVNAAFAASRIFTRDPEATLAIMREECLEGLREHFDLPDDQSLERLYARLVEGFCENPVPTAEGIHNAHRLQLGELPEIDAFNPLLMWDLSFAREAIKAR